MRAIVRTATVTWRGKMAGVGEARVRAIFEIDAEVTEKEGASLEWEKQELVVFGWRPAESIISASRRS